MPPTSTLRSVLLLGALTTPLVADAPAGYYNSVNATSSSTLRTTLHALIDDHTRIPYTATTTDTWNVLELADQNAGNTSQILDVYKNASYTKVGAGNTNYNREHTWPSSYGFPNDGTTNYPYTDCHHLFLVDDSYNSSRGNNPYRNCPTGCSELVTLVNNGEGGGSGVYPGNSNWRTGAGATGTWETWNDRRGDVARALMYMDVRYEGGTHGTTGAAEPNLILTDNESLIASSNTGSNVSTAYMGMLCVLLVWHAQDPVDAKEMARNDAVFQYQGNRNPFIDHPEWAQCLFANNCTPTGGGDTTPPAAPTAMIASARTTQIIVDWANNTETDLAGYDIYRSTASAGTYTKLNATNLTTSAWTDSTALVGTTYFYKTKARDNAANESAFSAIVSAMITPPPAGAVIWINEIHYDNNGTDVNEGVEIAGPANTSLTGWKLVGYDGATGAAYATVNLSGTIPNRQNGFGVLWFNFVGLQNGAPDGIALVDASNTVRQFLSYEGSFTATNSFATGMTSVNIGVSELSTSSSSFSLRLTGTGNDASDFTWQPPAAHSRAKVNTGQTLQP
jgi:endonuclease I